jgi:hypothetical protein
MVARSTLTQDLSASRVGKSSLRRLLASKAVGLLTGAIRCGRQAVSLARGPSELAAPALLVRRHPVRSLPDFYERGLDKTALDGFRWLAWEGYVGPACSNWCAPAQ